MNAHTSFIKIFAGYKMVPDFKAGIYDVHQSLLDLKIVIHKGKEYIGLYLDHAYYPSVQEIKTLHEKINMLIQSHFPEHHLQTHSFVLFPQLFLS